MFPRWPMVAHLAHSMGNQQDYPIEEETLRGPIRRVRGVVLPVSSKGDKKHRNGWEVIKIHWTDKCIEPILKLCITDDVKPFPNHRPRRPAWAGPSIPPVFRWAYRRHFTSSAGFQGDVKAARRAVRRSEPAPLEGNSLWILLVFKYLSSGEYF